MSANRKLNGRWFSSKHVGGGVYLGLYLPIRGLAWLDPGGGTLHMKGKGWGGCSTVILKETNLGVALAFLTPLKRPYFMLNT